MNFGTDQKTYRVGFPLLGILTTLGIAFATYYRHLGRLSQPMQLRGDATQVYRNIVSLRRYGSLDRTFELGWPTGFNKWDFPPIADFANVTVLRILSVFSDNPFLTANLFFIGTFVLQFVLAYTLLSVSTTSRLAKFFLGITYAFLPYHHDTGIGHIYLANYAILLIPVWFYLKVIKFGPGGSPGSRYLTPIIVGLSTGIFGIYYAAFSLTFYFVAALISHREIALLRSFVLSSLGTIAALGAQLFYVLSRQTLGTKPPSRLPNESDLYALKSVLIFTPSPYGVLGHLFQLHKSLQKQLSFAGEATSSTGLLLAVVGLSSIVFLARRTASGSDPVPNGLKSLALCFLVLLVALSTIIPSFIGLLGVNELRVWSRSTILLSTVLLFLAAELWQYTSTKQTNGLRSIRAWFTVLLVFGTLELGLGLRVRPNEYLKAVAVAEESEAAYAALIGAVEDPIVFQLPVVPYPEHPRVHKMWDYDHFLPSLWGSDARWSYGVNKFTPTQQECAFPESDFISCIARLGFNVIWIDTYGYVDGGAKVAQFLQELDPHGSLTSLTPRYQIFRRGEFS